VAVVIGSTRPSRICPDIARWVLEAAQADSPLHYELVDLAAIDLPFLDEPLMPSLGRYQHEHTRAWSRIVSSYDAFIFVFPQYNWGYPAPLKNALDFLYHEWAGKPVTYVTYGTHGGARAAQQIEGVLAGLKMRELDQHLEVVITEEHVVHDVDGNRHLRSLDSLMQRYRTHTKVIDAQLVEALP
jgi:NAD(P)H-dependent FMN reductase